MTFVLNLAIRFSLSLARFKATAKKAFPFQKGETIVYATNQNHKKVQL